MSVPPVAPLPVVAVAVMDEDSWASNTDNLAVVDPVARSVVSIPRDLWSVAVGDRINQAWREGGSALLIKALAEHGIDVEAAVCVQRSAVEAALDDVEVVVPVESKLSFLYPNAPRSRLEDGAIVVRFDPPEERLSGVRIHQWVGARREPNRAGSDLRRIHRQHTFIRALRRDGFDFRSVLDDPDLVHVSHPRALETLALVDNDWRYEVVDDVLQRTIEGKDVLVPATPLNRVRSFVWRGARRARSIAVFRATRVLLPTAGWRPAARRTRLLAVIAVHNEERFLPGWLANVTPHVDGVIALDDGSTDGSAAMLEAHPQVLTVIRVPPDRPAWDEVGNHRLLIEAAVEHHADWVIALDADERVERTFRSRVERAVRRGARLKLTAFRLPMRELWDSPTTWRADGVWGRKKVARLFECRADHVFDPNPLHASKAPLQGQRYGAFASADVLLYHMRMIHPDDRDARRARYETLDPDREWQSVGYAYLTDERGIRLRRVRPNRSPNWE